MKHIRRNEKRIRVGTKQNFKLQKKEERTKQERNRRTEECRKINDERKAEALKICEQA